MINDELNCLCYIAIRENISFFANEGDLVRLTWYRKTIRLQIIYILQIIYRYIYIHGIWH